jgi:hypothetical protein
MSNINNTENIPDPNNNQPHVPYWKRAHHDWKFWLVLFFMLAAMVIYIMTQDLQTQAPIISP